MPSLMICDDPSKQASRCPSDGPGIADRLTGEVPLGCRAPSRDGPDRETASILASVCHETRADDPPGGTWVAGRPSGRAPAVGSTVSSDGPSGLPAHGVPESKHPCGNLSHHIEDGIGLKSTTTTGVWL